MKIISFPQGLFDVRLHHIGRKSDDRSFHHGTGVKVDFIGTAFHDEKGPRRTRQEMSDGKGSRQHADDRQLGLRDLRLDYSLGRHIDGIYDVSAVHPYIGDVERIDGAFAEVVFFKDVVYVLLLRDRERTWNRSCCWEV